MNYDRILEKLGYQRISMYNYHKDVYYESTSELDYFIKYDQFFNELWFYEKEYLTDRKDQYKILMKEVETFKKYGIPVKTIYTKAKGSKGRSFSSFRVEEEDRIDDLDLTKHGYKYSYKKEVYYKKVETEGKTEDEGDSYIIFAKKIGKNYYSLSFKELEYSYESWYALDILYDERNRLYRISSKLKIEVVKPRRKKVSDERETGYNRGYNNQDDFWKDFWKRFNNGDQRQRHQQQQQRPRTVAWVSVFGFSTTPSTFSDVKKRYRELALKYHPDRTKTDSTEMMKKINLAYEEAKHFYRMD